jgi:hypothetical protein
MAGVLFGGGGGVGLAFCEFAGVEGLVVGAVDGGEGKAVVGGGVLVVGFEELVFFAGEGGLFVAVGILFSGPPAADGGAVDGDGHILGDRHANYNYLYL